MQRPHRTKRWKLIHFFEQPQEWELYDLETDPLERTNLASERRHAAMLALLKIRMTELRHELGDSDPPGPPAIAPLCRDWHLVGYPPPRSL